MLKLFQRSFFKSKDDSVEGLYQRGVRHLKANEHDAANKCLRDAAVGGHVSALYNLFVLNGSGYISPYDIDFAANCFYESAKAGHPSSADALFMLETADRAGLGTLNLAKLAEEAVPQEHSVSACVVVFAARFFHAVSEAHGATDEVITYELTGASFSDDPAVLRFIDRTGFPQHLLRTALPKLESGGAADQITDGLNGLSHMLRSAGNSERICRFVRCSILGYMVAKSPKGRNGEPLLGLKDFYSV